jgi:hypothetical protein
MKLYKDIKEARAHQRRLKEWFNWYRIRQEELRKYVSENHLTKDAPTDIRLQIYAYRKVLNIIQEDLKVLERNIRDLDREREKCRKLSDTSSMGVVMSATDHSIVGVTISTDDGAKYYITKERLLKLIRPVDDEFKKMGV